MQDSPTIAELFAQGLSDVHVVASGNVVRVLPDDLYDRDGTGRHQRFLVEVSGQPKVTVRISHNLAFGRVPIRKGQRIRFSGQYRHNDLGGIIHWTHRDPRGHHQAGFLEVAGHRYG
jgi:hypothetical protein